MAASDSLKTKCSLLFTVIDLVQAAAERREAVATAVAVRGEPSINRLLDIQAEQDTPAVEDIQEQDQAVRDNSRRKQSRSLAQ